MWQLAKIQPHSGNLRKSQVWLFTIFFPTFSTLAYKHIFKKILNACLSMMGGKGPCAKRSKDNCVEPVFSFHVFAGSGVQTKATRLTHTVSTFTWDILLAPKHIFPGKKDAHYLGSFSLSAQSKSANWTIHMQHLTRESVYQAVCALSKFIPCIT